MKISILGSTGSIGTQTLDIVRANKDLDIVALAAGSNIELLEKQIREFRPEIAAVWSEEKAQQLKIAVSDIDIKIVGARKGERLVEPLWLKEENPTPTKYKKLLKLKNIEYDSDRLKTLLEKLYPICFYTKGYEEDFRNKEKLLSILCEDCQSLKDFYQEIKTDGQKRTDIL